MPQNDKVKSLYSDGMSGAIGAWLEFNRTGAFETPNGLDKVAAFPPLELMTNTSGLTDPQHFAQHGATIAEALRDASPVAINGFDNILDFGSGVGRVARMFKGVKGKYTAVDVDKGHVAWMKSALDYVDVHASEPMQPLPFKDAQFDAVISISVFTHLNEKTQDYYLNELRRVSRSGALLFMTVHGERALARAQDEQGIFDMLCIDRKALSKAGTSLKRGKGIEFVLQAGHLTSENYEYGITFTGHGYVMKHWSEYFEIVQIVSGAIHDFQDIVVCRRN